MVQGFLFVLFNKESAVLPESEREMVLPRCVYCTILNLQAELWNLAWFNF